MLMTLNPNRRIGDTQHNNNINDTTSVCRKLQTHLACIHLEHMIHVFSNFPFPRAGGDRLEHRQIISEIVHVSYPKRIYVETVSHIRSQSFGLVKQNVSSSCSAQAHVSSKLYADLYSILRKICTPYTESIRKTSKNATNLILVRDYGDGE